MTAPTHRRTLDQAGLVFATCASVLLALWIAFFDTLATEANGALFWIDGVLCIVIATLLGVRLLNAKSPLRYLRWHWWQLLALLPLALPWINDHTLVVVLVLVVRFMVAAEQIDTFVGDRVTSALIGHFMDPIIDTIKRPITLAVLDEVIDVVQQGDYASNIRHALEENRTDIEEMVLDLIRNDPTTGKLKYVPFHGEIVNLTSETVLRIVQGALADPRTTELISDVIRNSATQIREAVRDES